jgi:hypothetical protein
MHEFMRKFRDAFAQVWLPRGISSQSQWSGKEFMLGVNDAPWVPVRALTPTVQIRARLRSLEAEAHAMTWQVKVIGDETGHVVRIDGADLDRVLLHPTALDEVFEAALSRTLGPVAAGRR